MEVRKQVQAWVDKIKPFLAEKKMVVTTHRCTLSLSPRELTIVHLNKTDQAIELLEARTYPYDDIGNLPLILAGIVKKNGLTDIPIFWLLSPDDYQLILIDSLPVPENEMKGALNWRIRSLINYPIDEAAVDYFTIPAKKTTPDRPMIAAVTAKRDALNRIIDIYKNAGLSLTTIDIPELALRNLTALYENDEKSTAMIYFTANTVILNITSQKMLYFTRRIHFQLGNEENKSKYEELSLEILRYFDYFQSQWRNPSPTRIFVAADRGNIEEIATSLTDYLMTKVEVFTLKQFLNDEKARMLLEQKCLLAFGSALREGNQYVPARD